MPVGAGTNCVPPLRGNLSPGDFGEPRALAVIGAPRSAPDRSCGRGPGAGRIPTGTWGFLGFPTRRCRAQGGGAPSVRLSAPVSSRAALRCLGRSAARVPGAGAVAEAPLGTLAFSLFSSKTSKTKRLSNLFGERSDAQRTSPLLLPLLLSEPPCGLGRISPGAHPHQRQPAGGGGALSAGVPRGVRGTVRIGYGSKSVGEGKSLGLVLPWGCGRFWG